MSDRPPPRPATQAARALGWLGPARALVPPVQPSASYVRDADGRHFEGHSYTRDRNPTYDQCEALLAELEGGQNALLFASGMAAAATVFETLDTGAHVLAPESMYWTLRRWLQHLAERGRIELELVPMEDLARLEEALRPGRTALVWIETPSNPTCAVTDVSAAADLAHAAGARVVADNTLATPVLTRPLELGADWVMHSASKQLNGHSDVVAGALVTRETDAAWERVRHERAYRGAILGPFEAWLLLRGMRTLFLRVRAASSGATRIAAFLAEHPAVSEVCHPGLPGHPGHGIAARQMDGGFGPLVSFRPRGGVAAARALPGRLELFADATSLGGVESLVELRSPVEGAGSPVPGDLLRLSVGIEDPEDLVADLAAALEEA